MGDVGAGAGMAYDPAVGSEIEQRYWREIWRTAVYDAVEEHRIDLARFGPVQAALVASEFEEPMLNVIWGAEAPDTIEAEHLADAVEWVRSHGVDHRIPLTPGSPTPSAAERWLRRRGYEQEEEGVAKFVRDISPPAFAEPPGIEIVEFDGDEPGESETFSELMVTGLGGWWMETFFYGIQDRPGWRAFVAIDEEERGLSCALMLTHEEVAELGPVAPMEAEAPGGGDCQIALLRHCILEAAGAGCRLIAAEAGEPDPEVPSTSYGNLLEAGFEQTFVRRDWRPPREAIEAERKRRVWWAG